MKITKWIGYTIATIAIFSLGIFIGYYVSSFHSYKDNSEYSKRRDDLLVRTEAYQPTCNELNKIGVSEVIKKGNDNFVVHVSNDYFVVFGFNAESGKAPVAAWWGADRAETLKQACGKQ